LCETGCDFINTLLLGDLASWHTACKKKLVLLRSAAKSGTVAEVVAGPRVGCGGEVLLELNALSAIREWSVARNRIVGSVDGYNWPFLQYEEETGRGKTNAF